MFQLRDKMMKRRKQYAGRVQPECSLAFEPLEVRLALDGAGGRELPSTDPMLMHFMPFPCLTAPPGGVAELCGPVDSTFGRDVHANRPGAGATELVTADDGFERVHSYLDTMNDTDVFSVVATGIELQVSALLFYVPTTTVLSVIAGSTQTVVGQYDSTSVDGPGIDGFVDCDCGDYGFIDLFPGLRVPATPGETYFVTITGGGADRGRYMVDVIEIQPPSHPLTGNPDSRLGEDPHVNQLGRDATLLQSATPMLHVDSYIDAAGDVDVFQFLATGNHITINPQSWTGQFQVRVQVFNGIGQQIADNRLPTPIDATQVRYWSDPSGFENPLQVTTNPGARYFVRISTGPQITGEYLFDILQAPGPTEIFHGSPDSTMGDDPHADTSESNATHLSLVANRTVIDTFVDHASDADVFVIRPDFARVDISAFAVSPNLKLLLEVWDSRRNLLATSRFATSELGIFDSLLNLSLDLRAGHDYYLRIRSVGETVGEYVLVTRQLPPADAVRDREGIDSFFGQDPHGDELGPDATHWELGADGRATVHSFLDSPTDKDVFQWTATSLVAHVTATSLRGATGLSLEVYGEDGILVSNDRETADPFGTQMVVHDLSTVPGQTYFIVVSGADHLPGVYFLELIVDTDVGMATDLPGLDEAVAALPGGADRNDAIGLLGDANFDHSIDGLDYAIWQQNTYNYLAGPSVGDFNVDGVVDGSDFNIWLKNRFRADVSVVALAASPAKRTPRAAASDNGESVVLAAVSSDETNAINRVIAPGPVHSSGSFTLRQTDHQRREIELRRDPVTAENEVRTGVHSLRRGSVRSAANRVPSNDLLSHATIRSRSSISDRASTADSLLNLDRVWESWGSDRS